MYIWTTTYFRVGKTENTQKQKFAIDDKIGFIRRHVFV